MLVYRNLLYTAITRAKRLVVIIGNPDILRRMIEDSNERERYSIEGEIMCSKPIVLKGPAFMNAC